MSSEGKTTQFNTQFRYSLKKPKPEEGYEAQNVCNIIEKSPFKLHGWITVGMLAVANMGSTISFSCIAPFYPGEAKAKGLTESETGIIFGIFELVIFCLAPLFGKLMHRIGSRRMFIAGITITGISTISFGFLNFLPGRLFFWASLTNRIVQAFGDAAFVTSSLAIAARVFSGNVASIVGILETFGGLGFTLGPLIGGFLYDVGGFQVPFILLGSILLLTTILSIYLLEEPKETEEEIEEERGILDMIQIPWVFLMAFSVVICSIAFGFLDLSLESRLKEFSLSPTMIGVMFFLCSAVYTLFAPLLGLLIDRFSLSVPMLVFAGLFTGICYLIIGPSPFLPIPNNLLVVAIALAILGISGAALYIPTYQNCLDAVKEHGFEDNTYTYGCVSGIMQSTFALGGFLGPTIGGAMMQSIGFAWTTSIFSSIYFIFIIMLLSYTTYRSCRQKHNQLVGQS
ncbi:unnamed protein product, partial [Mesorhabditis belari]|uniref:Major facilitator superfamily (MFS) profile domain-containing protein n=1 Tax=Mesorhabditis belari TaxID=2138241 RepID=A0AAF3EH91_9BILA